MAYETLNTNNIDSSKSKMFLDDGGTTGVARYDNVKYKVFTRLTNEQTSYLWRPDSINLLKDSKDYRSLTPNEQHIFKSVLSRQIILDSVQGKSISVSFGSLISLPELDNWISIWAYSETVHSESYTHIIRNVYSNPSEVFDHMMEIEEIVDCCKDITEHYDNLINYTQKYYYLGEGHHVVNGEIVVVSKYELKKLIWLCLNAVNVLEGIRFYASFVVSFSFAERKLMEGNAKIIRYIAKDENLHLASTQTMIKLLQKDDPDFVKIAEECKEQVLAIFASAAEQEKKWVDYLFKGGSMLGMNSKLLYDYVDYITQSRMESIGIVPPKHKVNPITWVDTWLNSKSTQVANQETENTNYRVDSAKMDIQENTFSGFTL